MQTQLQRTVSVYMFFVNGKAQPVRIGVSRFQHTEAVLMGNAAMQALPKRAQLLKSEYTLEPKE